ncbi:MAG TPA: hypothetical protein VN903_09690 [Polyangia bacterium]|nr:hypothetical protein [Polyangia bacterium]
MAAVGCSHGRGRSTFGAGAPVAETRDELLVATGDAVWRGDLNTAHAALTRLADRERGVPDSALDFWSELLALLRCEPLTRIPRNSSSGADRGLSDPWDGLRRLAQIERVRLAREGRSATAAYVPGGHLKVGLDDKQMVWPVENELWTDELPMPAVVSQCATTEAPQNDGPDALATPPRPVLEPEVALVSSAAQQLPAGHPAKPLLLVQAAVLRIERGEAIAATAPLARLDQMPAAGLTPEEHDRVVLANALAAVADPAVKPDALLVKARAALALKTSAPARRALSLLVAQRLFAAQRADDAVTVLGPPPHGDDAVGRYIAFKQMEAHARARRHGPLLAEAREVLARRAHADVEEDPTSTAVMDIALRTLLASPVSDETLEVLEALGPPRERLGRADAFAQAALEAGAFRSAMATFLWLYENDNDPNRQLQNLARASVAAARAGDRAEFARTFRLLAGQDDRGDPEDERKPVARKTVKAGDKGDKTQKDDKPKIDLKPRDGSLIASAESDKVREKRRATRSVNWQRALLVVARDALPALVEADDQPNLATLVETLKRHLVDGGRGPVDEELTTLYRAASAHLKSGARAYAETVGAARRPILLGDVLIGRKYDVPAPLIDLSSALDEIGTLLFVPRRGNDASTASIERWPGHLGVAWTGRRS